IGSTGSTRASSPRTTTRTTRRCTPESMGRGVSADMSAPSSAMTLADTWLMASPGWVPAEYTSTLTLVSWAWWRIKAAAIWDLPPFFTQTNNTLGVVVGVVMGQAPVVVGTVSASAVVLAVRNVGTVGSLGNSRRPNHRAT